jgi:hypothetical protein
MEWFILRQKIADYTSLLLQNMVKRKESKQKKLYTFFLPGSVKPASSCVLINIEVSYIIN